MHHCSTVFGCLFFLRRRDSRATQIDNKLLATNLKAMCLFLALSFDWCDRLLKQKRFKTWVHPNISCSGLYLRCGGSHSRQQTWEQRLTSCPCDSCGCPGPWQMICVAHSGRLLQNHAAFAAFSPGFPSCTHRHYCSGENLQTGRLRTPGQAGLTAGQSNRARNTGLSRCLQASSSGWEGSFSPHVLLISEHHVSHNVQQSGVLVLCYANTAKPCPVCLPCLFDVVPGFSSVWQQAAC